MTTLLAYDDSTLSLTYRLLPYRGEQGRTNLGMVAASAGVLTLPTDPSTLIVNREHRRHEPLGRFTALSEDDDGLTATVRLSDTTAGRDAYVEARDGLRAGISVEIDAPLVRSGQLMGGTLTGAGLVVDPAFPSALLVAADAGEDPTDTPEEGDNQADEADTKEEATVPDTDTIEQEPEALTASAPLGTRPASRAAKPQTMGEVFKMLANAHKQGGQGRLLAALSDIVPGDILGQEQPQYVGELWNGKAFVRRIIPLLNHAPLTSFKVAGWRWVTKPVVAAYAGNKAPIPSNAAETEPVTVDAERIAGGHDIDRKFRDFNDEEFWAAYWRAMTESYAQVSDAQVAADLVTAAGAPIPIGSIPSGVAPGMVAIVDGALAVLANTNSLPTFAVVSTSLYRGVLLTKEDDVLAYLNAAMGLEDGTVDTFKIIPSAALPADQVLVGARDAATVHELGETPIRVEALNIPNGGIDAAVFGYLALNIHDDGGLVLVDAVA